jgi:hypothetical protein
MGILDSIMRTFNVGGCRLVVAGLTRSHAQGGVVTGEIEVVGGRSETRCNAITIDLEEFWTESRGSGKSRSQTTVYASRSRQVLARQESFMAGDRRSYPFSLRLPENCRLSTSSTGWRVKAAMDIPGVIDPTCALRLNVTPAEAFRAVAAACIARFRLRESEKSWRWSKDGQTYFRMLPDDELRAEFDYIAFRLRQAKGGVAGKVIFNLQEKCLKDYFKAMLMMDRVEKAIHLPGDVLRRRDGTTDIDAIANVIDAMMRQIIKGRSEYAPRTSPGDVDGAEPERSAPAARRDGTRPASSAPSARTPRPAVPPKPVAPPKKPARKDKDFDPRQLDGYYSK